jgi:hypothetical protein
MKGARSATQQLRKSMIVLDLYFSDSVIDLRCVFHIDQMPFVFFFTHAPLKTTTRSMRWLAAASF